MTTLLSSTMDTPIGPLSFVTREDYTVLANGFTDDVESLRVRLPEPLRTAELREVATLGPVTAAAEAYFAGDVNAFDDLAVEQYGGPFLTEAWKVLRKVPAGQPVTYTEFAALAGRPAAVRAAASACARNLVAPIVPCHRVLRSDGSLGGYYYGLPIKKWLLEHESSH